MEKVITGPNAGDDLGADAAAFSESVAIEHPDHTRVYVSGLTSRAAEADIGVQTKDVLDRLRDVVDDHGGALSDVVRVRVYVEAPHLTPANFEAIHDVRREFFTPGAYPASTLVEVSGLIRDDRWIEIDADAVIPAGGWDG